MTRLQRVLTIVSIVLFGMFSVATVFASLPVAELTESADEVAVAIDIRQSVSYTLTDTAVIHDATAFDWNIGTGDPIDQTWNVNTLEGTADGSCFDGDCSLADAIASAGYYDTININVTGTIPMNDGDITINKNLLIDGKGGITLDGLNTSRIFDIQSSWLRLRNITFTNGNASGEPCYTSSYDGTQYFCGGALYVRQGASVEIENSVFHNNTADQGGAISNYGNTVVSDSQFYENQAIDGGAASTITGTLTVERSIFYENIAHGDAYNSGAGGAFVNGSGALLIYHSQIYSNSAVSSIDGTGVGGGIAIHNGYLTMTHTSVTGNQTGLDGGAIFHLSFKSAYIANSTLSNNVAGHAGGGISNLAGDLTVLNSTIVGNQAPRSGGIFALNALYTDTVNYVSNSIVAGNYYFSPTSMVTTYLDFDIGSIENLVSGGSNIIGAVAVSVTAFSSATNDYMGVIAPKLGPLQDNGGGVLTHALLPSSVAIDAADDSQCPAEDQRGIARVDGDDDGVVHCDIGAVEYVPVVFTVALASWPDIDISYNADAYYSLFQSSDPYGNYVEIDESGQHTLSGIAGAPSFWSIRSPSGEVLQTFGLFPFVLEDGDS